MYGNECVLAAFRKEGIKGDNLSAKCRDRDTFVGFDGENLLQKIVGLFGDCKNAQKVAVVGHERRKARIVKASTSPWGAFGDHVDEDNSESPYVVGASGILFAEFEVLANAFYTKISKGTSEDGSNRPGLMYSQLPQRKSIEVAELVDSPKSATKYSSPSAE